MFRFKPILFLVFAVILTLTACGGVGKSSPVEVKVNMSEFAFKSSMTDFQVGVTYRFVVTNDGALPHEFTIMLPLDQSSSMNMEEIHKDALVTIAADDLPAGATKTVEVTFTKPTASGELEFSCHVPGHYESGMHLPIVVK